jgi:hypothetical protein
VEELCALTTECAEDAGLEVGPAAIVPCIAHLGDTHACAWAVPFVFKERNRMPASSFRRSPLITTSNLGYPRIGAQRELKFALEDFWRGRITEATLFATAKTLRAANWKLQQDAGIDIIPSNDFSFYDKCSMP